MQKIHNTTMRKMLFYREIIEIYLFIKVNEIKYNLIFVNM